MYGRCEQLMVVAFLEHVLDFLLYNPISQITICTRTKFVCLSKVCLLYFSFLISVFVIGLYMHSEK